MSRFRTSIWTYPWDVLDEGIDQVLENIHVRGGVDGILLALSYHTGMFFLPHNPKRKLYYPRPSLYFQPDQKRYANLKIKPIVNDLAEAQLLGALRSRTAAHGMELNAWAVCLHNSALGTTFPECTMVTAFGDHIRTNLCPANPDVRAYMVAMLGDLLNRDFDSVCVESLEYMSFEHEGFHHEVFGLPFTSFISFLMELCFCPHCRQTASSEGVDVDAVQRFARQEAEEFFAGNAAAGRESITWPELKELVGGELGAFHSIRAKVVTSLYKQIRASVAKGKGPRLEVVDFGPTLRLGADDSVWESGLDLKGIAPFVDALHPTPYFLTAKQVEQGMDDYRRVAPTGLPLNPAIRSIAPQVTGAQDLLEKVKACRPEAVAGMTFYNYGFMRLKTLDWIKSALTVIRSERRGE